jgi:hypothetical protein
VSDRSRLRTLRTALHLVFGSQGVRVDLCFQTVKTAVGYAESSAEILAKLACFLALMNSANSQLRGSSDHYPWRHVAQD